MSMAPEEASQPEETYSNEESYQRAMVVIAHPDDAEYGCAGTVAKWCRQGMSVVYVVCTDGSKGSPDPNVDVGWLIETRQQEQRNACKVLGVEDVVFLNYEDAMLEPTLELRKDIAREIRRYRPDVMICETPMRTLKGHGYIGHPDHFASGEAAMAAMFPAARDRLTFPDLLADGFEPHKTPARTIATGPARNTSILRGLPRPKEWKSRYVVWACPNRRTGWLPTCCKADGSTGLRKKQHRSWGVDCYSTRRTVTSEPATVSSTKTRNTQ